ncbi:MAG TPA: hypothetical protein VJU53_07260, partial [Burkholderiaceae bacterium]|nr:hypothetical protein [Burkholderiaceae bacterium]
VFLPEAAVDFEFDLRTSVRRGASFVAWELRGLAVVCVVSALLFGTGGAGDGVASTGGAMSMIGARSRHAPVERANSRWKADSVSHRGCATATVSGHATNSITRSCRARFARIGFPTIAQ